MSSDRSSAPAPPSKGGWTILWLLLVLSLAGNAFFIGVGLRQGSFVPQRPGGDMLMNPRVFWNDLPPRSRQLLLGELRGSRAYIAHRYAALVDSRKQEIAAMRADPFDPAAYRKALQASAEMDQKAREDVIEFFVKTVSELSPEERKALAARLESRVFAYGRRRIRDTWERGGPGLPPPPAVQPGPPSAQTPPTSAQPQDTAPPPAP